MRENARINHLDGLRGVAIIFVILFHAYVRWPEYIPWVAQYKDIPILKNGHFGVQLFFIISGFVIYMTLERCESIMDFLFKRWMRLFPAMLVATLLIFFSANYLNERPAGIPSGLDVIPGLIFTGPEIINKIFGTQLNSIEGAFWSLYVEVKFYLIFGAIYFYNKKNSIYIFSAIFLFGFLYKIILFFGVIDRGVGDEFLFVYLSLNHFGWFCIGMFLYLYEKEGGLKYIALSFGFLFPALAMMGEKNIENIVIGTFIYGIFLAGLLVEPFARFLGNKILIFFGFISYPLYLIHENAMISLTIKLRATTDWLPDMLTPIPGLMVIVFSAYLITIYAELYIKKIIIRINNLLTEKLM